MSFILDALKKSESDRQRQSDPDISSVPTVTSKVVAPHWFWVVIGLLGINLVILTVVLVRPAPVSQPAKISDAAVPVAAVEPAAHPPQTVPAPINRDVDAIPFKQHIADVPVREMPPESYSAEPVERQSAPSASVAQLTFNDLRASGNINLPDLNMNIHVYSVKPADRFVFINMKQYRENATLAEGPVLREITAEGVVLEFAGASFLLPRD